MQEEIFDIVDENDQVTGQMPRSEVHEKGLKHRAVHLLIFNKEGEVFMQKRSKNKDTWPGAWDSSCSGHVDTGEDYMTAVLREVQEELGWKPTADLESLFKLTPSPETGNEFIEVYRTVGDGPFHLNLDEIEVGEWMNIPNVLERVEFTPKKFSSAFRLILDRLQTLQLLP